MGAFFSTFRFYYLNPRNLLFAFIISSLVGFHISERLFMSEENSKFRMKLLPITSPLWSGFSRTLQKLSNVVNTRFLKKLFQSKRKRNVFIKNRVRSIFSPPRSLLLSRTLLILGGNLPPREGHRVWPEVEAHGRASDLRGGRSGLETSDSGEKLWHRHYVFKVRYGLNLNVGYLGLSSN